MKLKLAILVFLAAVVGVLSGCGGSDGATGPAGATGAAGPAGPSGKDLAATVNAAALTSAEWAALSLKGTVTSVDMSKGTPVVTFKLTNSTGIPVTGLAQKDSTGKYPNFAFAVAKLKPSDTAKNVPSRWVSYFVVTTPAAGSIAVPGFPEAESDGTLTDNLDGSYTYVFALDLTKVKGYVDGATYDAAHVKADLDDVSYEPTLPHRLMISVGGNQPSTTTATGGNANIAYDFMPSTGAAVAATDPQRAIVDIASCNRCHSKLSMHAAFFPAIQDAKLCVVCHTDQQKYGFAENRPASGTSLATQSAFGMNVTMRLDGRALPNFPNMVHKIHMGEELYFQGYNQFNVKYNEVTYPQDQRNCVMCHSASTTTAQGDNWKMQPSRLACGACHDGINFATGGGQNLSGSYAGHVGGAQADDQLCTLCHSATAIASVYHIAVVPPNPINSFLASTQGSALHPCNTVPSLTAFPNEPACNSNTNASYVASVASNLPAGASKVAWVVDSVTVANGVPSMKFKFQKDGQDVVFNDPTKATELMDNFVGGPSLYWAFGAPQDGIAAPADFNGTVSVYLKRVWNSTAVGYEGSTKASSISGPVDGWYTVTVTGSKIPLSATMITGGIGYTYGLGTGQPPASYPPAGATLPWAPFATTTQPLTQTNVPGYAYDTTTRQGGLSVPAPNVSKLATVTGGTAGTNTARRAIVETARCNNCHQALGVFTAKVFHAGQRNDAPTCVFCHNVNRVNSGWGVNIKEAVHAIHAADKRTNKFSWEAGVGDKYWEITYPGVLNNCEQCHVPGSYDFSNAANAAAAPNLLWTTVATGTVPSPVSAIVTGNETVPGIYWSPFVTAGAAYGSGYSISAASGAITQAAATTLVSSPITSACAACHDSPTAIVHMKNNSGQFYVSRTDAGNIPAQPEACLICHGNGKLADIKAVHMN